MNTAKAETLDVPGARLHYEVRGSGPLVLLICGGLYDSTMYEPLADELADEYTVVTYDRRGNSRSPLDGPPEVQRIEVHGDDAHRVLAAVGEEPAYVFGNSSGALIGLELAARHPERVRVVVAHEPPAFELLPEREQWRTALRGVEDTYRAEGVGPAMAAFGAAMGAGGDEPAPEPTQEEMEAQAESMAQFAQNIEFFVGYEVPSFGRYAPDVAALRAASVRVAPALGDASYIPVLEQTTRALAEQLGAKLVSVPGDHGGFGTHVDGFAAALRAVFAG